MNMLKIKKLKWIDCTTPLGKEKGVVSLRAEPLPLPYSYNIGKLNGTLVMEYGWETPTVIATVEEGKELAQKHFEESIYQTFFEDDKV